MKKTVACKLLRKYGLVPLDNSNRFISFKKNNIAPNSTWLEFIKHVSFVLYLTDDLPIFFAMIFFAHEMIY